MYNINKINQEKVMKNSMIYSGFCILLFFGTILADLENALDCVRWGYPPYIIYTYNWKNIGPGLTDVVFSLYNKEKNDIFVSIKNKSIGKLSGAERIVAGL